MSSNDNLDAVLRVLSAPRRNQYFYGKRMDVQHFRMEQDYGRLKLALLNRLTLGKGVLCGLNVSTDGDRLCVDPGVAIDGLGREIVVPVRSCVDPSTPGESCCGSAHAVVSASANGFYTLWACYRECSADYQPVLASDCDTREQCAAGTTVETFCFKVTPGLPPLQGDPAWCARMRPEDPPAAGAQSMLADAAGDATNETQGAATPEAIREALGSRRHLLCALTDGACETAPSDPCVPIAAILLGDRRILAVESCLVRPRVYSNAMLLDLILCLAIASTNAARILRRLN